MSDGPRPRHRPRTEGADEDRLLGPTERERIHDGVGLVAGKADVPGRELLHALALKRAGTDGVRSFAVDLPRAGGVDGLAVDGQPCTDSLEDQPLLAVDRPVGPAGDIENERAVLAHRVDHPVDGVTRMHVSPKLPRSLIEGTKIMPVADTRLRLPGMLENPAARAPLDVGHQGLLQVIRDMLAGDDAIGL